MTDLNLGSNWQLVYQTSRVATPIFGTNKFNPIPKIICPVNFTSQYLTVGASSSSAKLTWHLAFYLDVFISVQGIGSIQVQHFFCPLGASLKQIDEIVSSYRLTIDIPAWYRDMNIEIWQFSNETN